MHSSKILYGFLIFFSYICSDLQAKQEPLYLVSKPLHIKHINLPRSSSSAEEFIALRAAAGMRPRSIASAEKGLKNSLFG